MQKIEAEFAYSPVINYAMQQNHVPVVRKLVITNTGSEDLQQISITISAEPDFCPVWAQHLDSLKAGTGFEFGSVRLEISAKLLAELTERMAARFTLKIQANNVVLFRQTYDVDLLAYDQWNGIAVLPEMVSAFITPNHPEIPHVIKRAAVILEKWTGSPSFDEYQSRNPDRVSKQMAAIYEAIAEMQIVYCSVPASFEATGQRVRLCDTIVNNRMANCLDLSLFYAACLEAVAIHPLLVFVKGHAFVGGWLIDESFADAVNDDPSLLTKRTAAGINEILLVESTCMNAGAHTPFDDAVKTANSKLLNDAEFSLFVDVKRSRYSGIRPLPLRVATAAGWETAEEDVMQDRAHLAPEEIRSGPKLVNVEKIDVSKQRLWERKLLDLTLRNSLLNFRVTKSAIPFISANIGQLEDALADGHEFQVLAKPADWDNTLRSTGMYQSIHASDPMLDLIKSELTSKRLRSYLTDHELAGSLTHLYRSSRVAIEENGANTLYIALGLLKWYETEVSEKPRYAPILLVPVEIVRKSALKGYVIRSREEEPMMNITLLEMLRQDFGINIGGLETLPKDESGVDVKLVLNVIRQAIMSKTRWDVEEQALLGTFSFSKFILWNDIHSNADKLCEHKIVASLVSGKLEWAQEEEDTTAEILDPYLHPASVALPISTDSSQLEAIVNSGKGKSFILHGPPGTGKSQTITNIIANALYHGKRVLFVAAKKAALDVVHTRLQSIGLGPFCLELHSNKTQKSAVLDQLKKTTEVTKKQAVDSFQSEAERLFTLRNELSGYVQELHKKYAFGFSLFEIFGNYGEFKAENELVQFAPGAVSALTENKVQEWNDLAEDLQSTGLICGHPHRHLLSEVYVQQYSQQLKTEIKEGVAIYQDTLQGYAAALTAVKQLLMVSAPVETPEQAAALKELATLIGTLPDIPASLLACDAFEQTLQQVITLSQHGMVRDGIRTPLLKDFNKEILDFPASRVLVEWKQAEMQWFLPKWLKQRSITKSLKLISRTGTTANIPEVLQNVINYQEEQVYVLGAVHLYPVLGFLLQGGECQWQQVPEICNTLIKINKSSLELHGTAKMKTWRDALSEQFSEGSKAYVSVNKKTLTNFLTLSAQLEQTEQELTRLAGIDFVELKKVNSDWISYQSERASRWTAGIDSLKDWCNWVLIRDKALKAGLKPLVNAYENGLFVSENLVSEYKKGLYRSCADYIIENNPLLVSFNGLLFEEKIKKFKTISKSFERLTKEELYARLAAKIPSFTQEAAQSSEIGILQRTIRNNGRGVAIRKLFDSIPNLLPRLSPCMLMSPISVAQYFDSSSPKFDLVIFDEASQMPTCEAVGAIARGNNLIVVGDPKQMPPTNFFSTNNIDEDNMDKEDLESILDDCLALSMPSKHLLWHYRSKHESLIAFSNANYYDNKLLTFPSTDDITTKVQHVPVAGFYDKGKTRQNRFEAEAIVKEVTARLADPVLRKRSIGIVTFSSVQQMLIEDLLTEVFRTRPDLEKIALEAEEPLFVKNLENVQGDERDVILFSICYGPDEQGKVSINFGPINREGGWRRLNVAVSRARYEMKVFSTLRSDQIDLARTSSEGVAGLKAFLAFAEKGKTALPNRIATEASHSSQFQEILAAEIRKAGYEVHTNIGCSSYKIDLGIVDAADPSCYILGILCDGKNYYAARTSRDREIVQVDVLKALGWNLHRVWSVEWWEHPGKTIGGILEAIKQCEREAGVKKENEHEAIITNTIPEPVSVPAPETFAVQAAVQKSTLNLYADYEMHTIPIVVASSEEFLLPVNRDKICVQVMNILDTESPISKNLLCKRVLGTWGISRLGTRLNVHFESIFMQLNLHKTTHEGNVYFWKPAHNPAEYALYRVASQEHLKRDPDDLPPEEIANGIRTILTNQISLPKPDLVREVSKLFGYAKVGSNVEIAMHRGIQLAVDKGFVVVDGEKVVVKVS